MSNNYIKSKIMHFMKWIIFVKTPIILLSEINVFVNFHTNMNNEHTIKIIIIQYLKFKIQFYKDLKSNFIKNYKTIFSF